VSFGISSIEHLALPRLETGRGLHHGLRRKADPVTQDTRVRRAGYPAVRQMLLRILDLLD
jgi:hypothetical protein